MISKSVETQFQQWLEQSQHEISTRQLQQFKMYFEMLVLWNEKMNLTAITSEYDVYLKHFYDSLTILVAHPFDASTKLADIGSGAGFPSIPICIMRPDVQVTIVDSLNKRIRFLQELVDQLQLTNVQCIHGRAEDVARLAEHRDQYDVVTARAVARLPLLNELCLPFVKPQGLFIAMKSNDYESELSEAKKSLQLLRAQCEHVHTLLLPGDEVVNRANIIIRKTSTTPKQYPRKPGTPAKSPLV
jgi:16S rRNA (guanine527-N7)-methyltransferase